MSILTPPVSIILGPYPVVLLAMIFLASADSTQEGDTDEKGPNLVHSLDKSDWVDYGDMFTYDPSTKTNREPLEMRMPSDEKTSNDYCGKASYMIIRRLTLVLSKLIRSQHLKGSFLKLSVNLDEFHFEMPADVHNLSDCDYLGNINAIADQILPSIVIDLPDEPYDYTEIFKYTILAAAALWYLVRIPLRMRLWSLIIAFFLLAYIWEFMAQYYLAIAKSEAKSSSLSHKCTSQSETTWLWWLTPLLPKMGFDSLQSECDEYFMVTRVNPLLLVNPIMIFFNLYDKSFLHGFRLTANTFGVSVATFFSRIPVLAFPFILIASVFIIIFALKYSFKYSFKYSSKPIKTKQKTNTTTGRKKKIKLLNQSSQLKATSKPDPRINQRVTKALRTRCGSTGDISKLPM